MASSSDTPQNPGDRLAELLDAYGYARFGDDWWPGNAREVLGDERGAEMEKLLQNLPRPVTVRPGERPAPMLDPAELQLLAHAVDLIPSGVILEQTRKEAYAALYAKLLRLQRL